MPGAPTNTQPGGAASVPVRTGVAIGAAAGLLSGLFGIGGGIVIVPALIALTAMDRKVAHGTSLGATLPVAAASLVTYSAAGNVDWPVAACLATGAIVGAVVGTQLLKVIPKRPLTLVFVIVVMLTAARLVLATEATGRDDLSIGGGVLLVAIGLGTGTLSGLLGIGGGVIMVPALIVLFSEVPVIAKGTSVAVIVPASLVGTIRNRTNRNTELKMAGLIGVAGIIPAVIGSLLADLINDTLSNVLFAGLLVTVAILQLRTLRPWTTPTPATIPPVSPPTSPPTSDRTDLDD